MTVVYHAEVVSSGDGRNGTAHSADGKLDLSLTPPKETGGSGEGTNPEQLFAAGYAACFHSALRLSAREAGIVVSGSTVAAGVDLIRDGHGYRLAVELVATLPNVAAEVAATLVEQAHQRCPYSKATRGNIEVSVRATN